MLLIPLARPNGIVAFPALLLLAQELYFGLPALKTRAYWRQRPFLEHPAFWILLFMPLCFGGWLLFQYGRTGLFFAFKVAEQGWLRHLSLAHWDVLFKTGDFFHQVQSFWAVSLLLLLLGGIRRHPVGLTVLCAVGILLPLFTGTTQGINRYSLVYFPLFMTLQSWIGALLERLNQPALRWGLVSLGLLILLAAHYWSLTYWIKQEGLGI